MAPEKVFVVRGVRVVLRVGMAMVPTMVGCPPQGTTLSGSTGNKPAQELDYSTGVKGTVGKITVIKGSNCKHASPIGEEQDDETGPSKRSVKG